jgi:hypothetical protein
MSGLFREIGGKVEKWVVKQRDGWLRRESSGFLREMGGFMQKVGWLIRKMPGSVERRVSK